MTRKIAVLGAGANGASIGADLTRAGEDVLLIEQWPAHVEAMRANVTSHAAQVLDARSRGRFAGTEPEPRAGLRSGHIPGSLNLPYETLYRPDGTPAWDTGTWH